MIRFYDAAENARRFFRGYIIPRTPKYLHRVRKEVIIVNVPHLSKDGPFPVQIWGKPRFYPLDLYSVPMRNTHTTSAIEIIASCRSPLHLLFASAYCVTCAKTFTAKRHFSQVASCPSLWGIAVGKGSPNFALARTRSSWLAEPLTRPFRNNWGHDSMDAGT